MPTDNTLEYNSDDELAVNVQDVIEHLQERIRYYTNATTYSNAGASVGQAYETSQYRKIITKVEVLFDPLVGADAFLVRLVELNSDNSIKAKLFTSNTRTAPFGAGAAVRSFTFHDADGDAGVTIGKGIRLGILLSRTGDNSDSSVEAIHGSKASNSPGETYDDASVDFSLVNDLVYNHIDPAVNASTHSHGTDIRGNIKIFYTNIIDHGNLVGDGRVNAAHINSGTSDEDDVLTSDGSGGATWEPPAASGGGSARSYYWGAGQTERLPVELINVASYAVNAGHIKPFNSDTADESFNGGVAATWVDISTVTDADPTTSEDRTGFSLPAGLYNIDFWFYGNDGTRASSVRLNKVTSGTDDVVVLSNIGRVDAAIGDSSKEFILSYKDFTVLATDTFYISFIRGTEANNRLAGFLRIEEAL